MIPEEIHLSPSSLSQFRVVGGGTDGIIYQYTNNILLKIYRNRFDQFQNLQQILELPDQIFDKKNYQPYCYQNHLSFQKQDDLGYVKLYSKDTIAEVVKKGQFVKRSHLPKGPVYLDSKFVGCFLQKISGIPIHNFRNMPRSFKRTIIASLVDDVEELLNHFIYPIDLHNSPFSTIQYLDSHGNLQILQGHSHVLVSLLKRKTHLLDLDGKSTIYTDYFDQNLYQQTLHNFTLLLLEFLHGFIFLNEYYEDMDVFFYELQNLDIDPTFAQHVVSGTISDINEIKRSLKI
jgi:hypothetical protein